MHKIQKLLAVAAVFVLAVSLICVPVSATASTSTVTIDGTDYDVVFSDSTGYASTGGWWNQNDAIWDSTFINALNTDGAVLVFVRSTNVASSGSGNTFQLVDSSWSASSIVLGTCLTNTTNSDGISLDYIYDDGIYAMYDAKSVYSLWTSRGYTSTNVTLAISAGVSFTVSDVYVLTESATSTPSYSVSVDSVTGGTVTSSANKAKEGDTVTLTVSSSSSSSAAYRISALSVTDASGATVELTNNHDGTYTFTMPASNVTVTPAFEDSGFRYFYVNGVKIQDVLDYTVECGDGTAVFNPTTNTLTLTNATITTFLSYSNTYRSGIYVSALSASAVPEGLTIEIVGDNNITGDGTSTGYCLYSANVNTDVVGVDGGTLTLSSTANGINFATSSVSYSISDCTITATSLTNNPINCTGTTTISDSTITISNSVRGIYATGALTITGCDITANCTATNAYGGIYSTNSNSTGLTITDSNVTLSSGDGYNSLYARMLTVSGSSTVVANGGYSTGKSYGSITLDPGDGYTMSILVGTSESDATTSVTAAEETAISTGYTDYYYKDTGYTYFAIVSTGIPSNVTVSEAENGTVTADAETAATGDTVTVTVTADEGYELSTITVTDANGNDVTVTDNGDGTYSFTMPASDVTVVATFVESTSESTTSHNVRGTIYVNEQYHGIFINGHLACVPHSVNAAGYCTVCGEYIGFATEESDEAEVEETETTEETVDIEEPVEDTDTDTEEDELPVEDDEPAAEAESNPTTGAALALLPMAIAGLAAAISKRK